uniref:EGF-like domain-containing protein n=1 Tax=Panagrolaimus davidi TaxID=227884 RepID=A0A914QCW2_9BILA
MPDYKNSCVCKERYEGLNCAHFLTNWLIENKKMEPNLAGCYTCPSGRPIRAIDVRNHYFIPNFTLTNDPGKKECFIYCKNNDNGREHVYYGTKNLCSAGTGLYPDATKYEYYI